MDALIAVKQLCDVLEQKDSPLRETAITTVKAWHDSLAIPALSPVDDSRKETGYSHAQP